MSWRTLTQDWTIKLFSLGVAILLFLFVSLESATPADVDFRIEYRTAEDIMLTNDAPTLLHTTLQGPWAAFRAFDIAQLEPVIVDLSHAGPGTVRHTLDMASVNPPAGMRVVAIRPAELEITLDRRVERQVPVHPDIPDMPAYGFEILDVRIVPPRVRVVGPVSKMQSIDFITTRSIDVAGREDDLSVEADLRPPPPPLRLVDKRVTVFAEIGEEFVQRSFHTLPVHLDHAPKGATLMPSSITLNVRGPRRVLDKLAKDDLDPFVDASLLTLDTVELPVQLRRELPDRTQIVAPIPKVEVQLQSKKSRRR